MNRVHTNSCQNIWEKRHLIQILTVNQVEGQEIIQQTINRLEENYLHQMRLDNDYGLLFIRGERPVFDKKYDILKHPRINETTDGNAKPYLHGKIKYSIDDWQNILLMYVAVEIEIIFWRR